MDQFKTRELALQYETRGCLTLSSMDGSKLRTECKTDANGLKTWQFYYQHIPVDSSNVTRIVGHRGQVLCRVLPHPASYKRAAEQYAQIKPTRRPPLPANTEMFKHDEVYYDLVALPRD